MTPPGAARLSARDWERAALEAITHGGLAAVAVEPLARTLGVTKGSFYAHFRNRDELVEAALDSWRLSHGRDGLAAYAAIADPAERLRRMITAIVTASQHLTVSIQVSLLRELEDERVAAAVRVVNADRLDFLTDTYRELGLPPDRAAYRAQIGYAALLGLLHLARADPERARRGADLTAFVDEAVAMLLPDG